MILPMHPIPTVIELPAAPAWLRFEHHPGYLDVVGRHCRVGIEPRPVWCDRGRWIAKLDAGPELGIDGQDGWPRYYMDLVRAIAEVAAWIEEREGRR